MAKEELPWIAGIAKKLGLHTEDTIVWAVKAQQKQPFLPIDHFLPFGAEARDKVLEQVSVDSTTLRSEAEEHAFRRWAKQELGLEPKDIQQLVDSTPQGTTIWEAFVASDVVELETTPAEAEGTFACGACHLELPLPAQLVPFVDPCPACGRRLEGLTEEEETPSRKELNALNAKLEEVLQVEATPATQAPTPGSGTDPRTGAPTPDTPLLEAATRKLHEECLEAWALERGVSHPALEEARAENTTLSEALVSRGAIALHDMMEVLTSGLERVHCSNCWAQVELSQALLPYMTGTRCSFCDGPMTKPGDDQPPASEGGGTSVWSMVGGYQILRPLGRGGMGQVVLAKDDDGNQVAIKLLSKTLSDENNRERFAREGSIAKELKHPNIVALLDRGMDEERKQLYLVLEYVDGTDLQGLLRKAGENRLSVDEAVLILHRCARALAYAHARGVIHRDIKPANVLITREGDVKLTDFGISLSEDVTNRLTRAGQLMGTPQYICPEVLRSEPWTTAADLYSLGALAYRLLSGRHVYQSKNVIDLLHRHMEDEAEPLTEVAPWVPPPIADLVHRLLRKDPKARPSAEDVRAALGGLTPATARMSRLWTEALPPPAETAEEDDQAHVPNALEVTLVPQEQFDKYVIQEELGRGASGVVYKAHHPGLGKTTALKILALGALAREEERHRFLREAKAVGKLQHPNIVPIIDAGEHGGTCYLAMEFVEGEVLRAVLHQGWDLSDLLAVFGGICDGVQHAHSRGVIHRDLKPDNILVTREAHVPRILDFGIAKQLEQDERTAMLTTEGDVIGTLRYMPPEQAGGQLDDVDVRSDVYALGSILYEMVCGRTPFMGNVQQLLQQIHFEEPRAPSTIRPDVPWELDAICAKALEKKREQRYQSALELKRDLERYLNGLPITARPITVAYRFRKFAWRHRRAVAAITGVVALVLLLSASLLGLLAKQRSDHRRLVTESTAKALELLAKRRYQDAMSSLAVAVKQSEGDPDEVFLLPADRVSLIPEELKLKLPEAERARPRIRYERLVAWSAFVKTHMEFEQANELIEAAEQARREGRLQEAAEAAGKAALLTQNDPQVRRLCQAIAQQLARQGQDYLRRAEAPDLRISLADRERFLEEALAIFTKAEGLDPTCAEALSGKLMLESAREQLKRAERQRDRRAQVREKVEQARQELEDARSLSGLDKAAEAVDVLQAARVRLSLAHDLLPELLEPQLLSTEVALALGEIYLSMGKLELAQAELDYAQAFGLLAPRVEALAKRVGERGEHMGSFRRQRQLADAFYEAEEFAKALGAYDLALEALADPDTERRRDLCRALSAAQAARQEGDAEGEYHALLEARSLHTDPKALDPQIQSLALRLYEAALSAADASYRAAAEGRAPWSAAISAYERALRFSPEGEAARRGRADACAEQSLPVGMKLVSVPVHHLAEGAETARATRGESRRFYVDRLETTNAEYAAFVKAGGYRTRALWSEPGWGARQTFRDTSQALGPAGWHGGAPLAGTDDLPVTGVSYHEAQAYARWREKRLLGEQEWVLSACLVLSGGEALRRAFPWGDAVTLEQRAQLRRLRPVGRSGLDRSPWGVLDMGFNASEWVEGATVRGLSFRALAHDLTLGALDWRKTPGPNLRSPTVGFRCARDVPPPPPLPGEGR